MPKFQKKLVGDIREEHAFQQQQQELKEKYDIEKDVVVVEKTNAWKFTITMIVRLIKLLATMAILCLAVVGLYTLIYPEIREVFLKYFEATIHQINKFIS